VQARELWGGIGFGIKIASGFIQALPIITAAGLTLNNAHQAFTSENPREAKVYAALAILGVWGVWSSTRPLVGSSPTNASWPTSRAALNSDLMSKGFRFISTGKGGNTRYKHPDGREVTIKPTGEVIPVRKVLSAKGNGSKFPQRENYDFQKIPDGSHSTNHFVEPIRMNTPALAPTAISPYDQDGWEWQSIMNKKILADVSLASIDFIDTGTALKFTFSDIDGGKTITEVECRKLLNFDYTTVISLTDDEFATYVGDVNVSKTKCPPTVPLKKKGFTISGPQSAFWQNHSHVFEVTIESAETSVTVICGEILMNGIILEW